MEATRLRQAVFGSLLIGFALAACSKDTAVAGYDDPEAQPLAPLPPFETIPHTFTVAEAKSGIATGDFLEHALVYGQIAVDPKYNHVMTFQMTPMAPPLRRAVPTHGPIILFSDDMDVIVFGPLDHFFETLVTYDGGRISVGLGGDIGEVPAGFRHRFLEVRGHGMNATIARFGELLLADRGRPPRDRYADPVLAKLGYWTDNGAAYYYSTAPNMNEEDTLLAVKADAAARGIPYGHFQLDSWWYFKSKTGGVVEGRGGTTRWEPQPQMFPTGLGGFQKKLGLPIVAHNRWFARENDYRAATPFTDAEPIGAPPFIAPIKEASLPLSRGTFDMLLAPAAEWNLVTYEQDWLMPQFWSIPYLRNGIGHSESWMAAMHDAAASRGITMQLCMAGAAHILDSVDRPAATNVRTSIDYTRSVSKESFWPQFHIVNMLAGAVGLWPFKDNFQSNERCGEQEAMISALSAGPVGVSDEIGTSNAALILKTCRADGTLLKPDRPATPIDAMFVDHQRPFITTTYSDRPGLGRWTYVAAYHLASEHPERTEVDTFFSKVSYGGDSVSDHFVFPAKVTDWGLDLGKDLRVQGPVVVYDTRKGDARVARSRYEFTPFENVYDSSLLVLAPILSNGLALIGETSKFVTMADKRFQAVDVVDDARLRVVLTGSPGEAVTLRAFDTRAGKMAPDVTASIGPDGTATVEVGR